MREFGLCIKEKPEDCWDFNPPEQFTVFLDIKFRFDATKGLSTDVNIKETDSRAYLHFKSYHPKQTFPSIVYSQALRYRRIINDDVLLQKRLDELSGCFLRSGYPKGMVAGIMKDVSKRPRKLEYKTKDSGAPFPVVWVQTFSPATPVITELVREANKAIRKSPVWKDVSQPIGIVNKRGRNIGDQILKRKLFALEDDGTTTSGTSRCTSILLPGQRNTKRGRPCESCNLMSEKCNITSNVSGKTFPTADGNCRSKRLIYSASCRICCKQYVGKTDDKLQSRISGHRGHMKSREVSELEEESDVAALADHLRQEHQLTLTEEFNQNYVFTILKLDPCDLDKCEQEWVSRLVTMRPFGLNIEKPCGVSDSVLTMAKMEKMQR